MDPEELDPTTLLMLLAGHLRERVVTHPVSTLGGVAAVGYVLGFGLPGALLRTGGALALRAATMLLLEEVLRPLVDQDAEPGSSNGRVVAGSHVGGSARGDADPYIT